MAPADPEQSQEVAGELTRLLADCDAGATDFVTAHHAVLRPLFAGDDWARFAKLVQDYAFADAQERLEQALARLPRA